MPILFVDLETTSVREPWLPGGRQIWQQAAVGIDQAAYAIHDALADACFVRDVYDALSA